MIKAIIYLKMKYKYINSNCIYAVKEGAVSTRKEVLLKQDKMLQEMALDVKEIKATILALYEIKEKGVAKAKGKK